jgi:P27 family predicted phage terminase small subunit
MGKEIYKIPTTICVKAQLYMKTVLTELKENEILENVDFAALDMLAINYSIFIEATDILNKEGLTVLSDRNNIAPHPLIKVAKDAQSSCMKVMKDFGLTALSRKKITPNG